MAPTQGKLWICILLFKWSLLTLLDINIISKMYVRTVSVPPVLLCCLDQEYSSCLEATENKREQGSLLLLQKTWSTAEAATAQWLTPQGKEKIGACAQCSGFSGACLTDWFLSPLCKH